MKNLNDLMSNILSKAASRDDRTGTGTIAIFGSELRWDLKKGFPIPTTKKLNLDAVVEELLWFISGDTNTSNLKSKIWKEWASESGSIGPMYGAMWRRRPVPVGNRKMVSVSELNAKYKHIVGAPNTEATVFAILDSNAVLPSVEVTSECMVYIQNVYNAWVHMLWTAYGKEIKALNISKGVQYDESEQIVPSAKVTGDETNAELSKRDQVDLWLSSSSLLTMPDNFNTEISCKEGHRTQVVAEWLDFDNFLNDFSSLPFNEDWMFGGNTVTTYLHGAMVYSKKTTTVLTTDVRLVAAQRMREYGPQVRPVLWTDQLDAAIELIKNNPTSRRIVIDSWEPATLPLDGVDPTLQATRGHCALALCHPFLQFFVEDTNWEELCVNMLPRKEMQYLGNEQYYINELKSMGYKEKSLSLKFTMRSSDVCLGLPFNIACYALLTHMVAQVCDLNVGELIYSGGDTHIYKNHINQAAEQIKRKVFEIPALLVNEKVGNIDDFKRDDFRTSMYLNHGITSYTVSK